MIDNELYLEEIKQIADDTSIPFNKMRDKKVLITGGTGLICSVLVDVLMYRNEKYNDNIKIYLVSRHKEKLLNRFKNYEVQEYPSHKDASIYYMLHDICKPLVCNETFDIIIHGASNTHPLQYATDPIGTITTNVLGFNNLLEYCIKHPAHRILLMSSVEIYGENIGDVDKFDENYLGYINCNTLRAGYPESKRLAESLCQAYISKYDMDIIIGRFSRVYGATMQKDDSRAISQFIRKTIDGENVILKSEGTQYYSYCYAIDAVSALLTILLKGQKGEAYNIADEKSDITLKELAQVLANINGKEVIFELPSDEEKKGFSTATKAILDSSKIKKLGWKARYDIYTGLKRTIEILKKETN